MAASTKITYPRQKSTLLSPPLANLRASLTLDEAIDFELKNGFKMDLNMDTKDFRRIMSNRLSAHRSRMKSSQYINNLENIVKDLEEKISILSPKVVRYKEAKKELLVQYDLLQTLVKIRSIQSRVSEIEIQQKQLELRRLQELAGLHGT